MNENLYKACGFFIEAMRLFEVSFIQSVCGSKKWVSIRLRTSI